MSMPSYLYHRINTNSVEPFVEARLQDFVANDEYHAHLRSLLTFRRATLDGKWDNGDKNLFVERGVYSFWCADGELRELTVFMDEDGRSKNLLPNHRANALIDAGRFTSKDRIQFNEEGRNQSLKEHHGCNFVYGDVVCEIPIGTAGPDHSVYNNNPLWYIVQPREPTTEMINLHGKELARNKLVPTRKKNIPASIMTPRDPVWEDTAYYVAPNNCTDFEFKMLLKLWGVQPDDLDRLFMKGV